MIARAIVEAESAKDFLRRQGGTEDRLKALLATGEHKWWLTMLQYEYRVLLDANYYQVIAELKPGTPFLVTPIKVTDDRFCYKPAGYKDRAALRYMDWPSVVGLVLRMKHGQYIAYDQDNEPVWTLQPGPLRGA